MDRQGRDNKLNNNNNNNSKTNKCLNPNKKMV